MSNPIRVGDLLPDVLAEARAIGDRAGRARATGQIGRKRKGRTGRPTRLHAGLTERICTLIRQGNYQETAAMACGVPKATYHSWKARGQEARAIIEANGRLPDDKAGERLFLDFLDAVEAARAEAESSAVVALTRLAFGGEVTEIERHLDPDTEEVVGETIRFSKPDGTSLRWFLERGFPANYGKRIEVGGPEQGPIPVEVEISARDILKKRLGQVAARLVEPTEDDDAEG